MGVLCKLRSFLKILVKVEVIDNDKHSSLPRLETRLAVQASVENDLKY
jgi:hypothetical protein